jgi:cation transport ATPase
LLDSKDRRHRSRKSNPQAIFSSGFRGGTRIPCAEAGSPMLAALAMSLSSVSVIGNALRLRRVPPA